MTADQQDPVRAFVLVPKRDLGHAIARKLREDPAIQVIGVSTDADQDAYRIYDADPDVIVADFEAGGLEFLYTERLPPGKHRVVFFAPRSEAGCDACYEALVHGAQGIMCRPHSAEDVAEKLLALAALTVGPVAFGGVAEAPDAPGDDALADQRAGVSLEDASVLERQ